MAKFVVVVVLAYSLILLSTVDFVNSAHVRKGSTHGASPAKHDNSHLGVSSPDGHQNQRGRSDSLSPHDLDSSTNADKRSTSARRRSSLYGKGEKEQQKMLDRLIKKQQADITRLKSPYEELRDKFGSKEKGFKEVKDAYKQEVVPGFEEASQRMEEAHRKYDDTSQDLEKLRHLVEQNSQTEQHTHS